MDYMEQSTLHIKLPKQVHIAAKVNAARKGTSMNQYVIDLITGDTPDLRAEVISKLRSEPKIRNLADVIEETPPASTKPEESQESPFGPYDPDKLDIVENQGVYDTEAEEWLDNIDKPFVDALKKWKKTH